MVKRRLIGGVILFIALNTTFAAEPPATAIIGTPPQPTWSQLSPKHQETLAPLAKDWDKMENIRKKKWLGIADRYPSMKQDEQHRMQERMREWANLTPDQRAKVRSSYKDFNQLPPEQKQLVKQKWEAYTNLPPEQQQRLREAGKSSKLIAPANSAAAANTADPNLHPETAPTPVSTETIKR